MVNRALYNAATGMAARQFEVEVISNNIANINSNAYKKQRAESADLFYQYYKRAGANGADINLPSGIYVGAGSKIQGVSRLHTEGSLRETGNDLHVAVNGKKGYFKIEMPDGTISYTRAGNFGRNEAGQIVTHDGYLVSPNITIPIDSKDLMISEDGTVSVIIPNVIDPQILGQFIMVDFINQEGLELIGKNLYVETISSGPPVEGVASLEGFSPLIHRWVENSNVDITTELTDLITAQRGFDNNSKVMQIADEMMSTVNQSKK